MATTKLYVEFLLLPTQKKCNMVNKSQLFMYRRVVRVYCIQLNMYLRMEDEDAFTKSQRISMIIIFRAIKQIYHFVSIPVT
jgi:hypothetical protein